MPHGLTTAPGNPTPQWLSGYIYERFRGIALAPQPDSAATPLDGTPAAPVRGAVQPIPMDRGSGTVNHVAESKPIHAAGVYARANLRVKHPGERRSILILTGSPRKRRVVIRSVARDLPHSRRFGGPSDGHPDVTGPLPRPSTTISPLRGQKGRPRRAPGNARTRASRSAGLRHGT